MYYQWTREIIGLKIFYCANELLSQVLQENVVQALTSNLVNIG